MIDLEKLRLLGVGEGDCRIATEAAAEIDRLRFVLQQISIGNVGCIVKAGESPEGANLRVIKALAGEALNR